MSTIRPEPPIRLGEFEELARPDQMEESLIPYEDKKEFCLVPHSVPSLTWTKRFFCTRLPGHEGPHVASNSSIGVLMVWDEQDCVVEREKYLP